MSKVYFIVIFLNKKSIESRKDVFLMNFLVSRIQSLWSDCRPV